MLSTRHEALVALLRETPRLVPTLAARTLGCAPPARVTVADAGFPQRVPPERRADLVVSLPAGGPWRGVIVEVQLERVARKRLVWPLYAAALRARRRGPVLLVVVAPDQEVAAWARRPIALGQPDGVFVPFVLGPESIPRVTSAACAARRPGLALLSTFAHGNDPGGERIALSAMRGARQLDPERAAWHTDILLAALDEAARRRLEALMQTSGYPFSDVFRKHYVRGLRVGAAEGEARGKAESVLAVLAARGLRVPARDRARVLGCDDQATLDAWIAAAATAGSVAEVLAAKPAAARRRPARPGSRRRAASGRDPHGRHRRT